MKLRNVRARRWDRYRRYLHRLHDQGAWVMVPTGWLRTFYTDAAIRDIRWQRRENWEWYRAHVRPR